MKLKYVGKLCYLQFILVWCMVGLVASAFTQSTFYRNDAFDFTDYHYVIASGNDPDNFTLRTESNSDFHNHFKLRVQTARMWLSTHWYAHRWRVDMNNDGIWEQNWTTATDLVIPFIYPNPTDGIVATHTIKMEIDYYNQLGQHYQRTRNFQIRVFSTPRVYVNAENDVFVQLRNRDCASRVPVLLVEGFDPLNDKYPETYYNLTYDMVNSDLYPNGYEVFILNFHNGGRDLRLNAGVLLKCLEKIHEICPDYQIAVGGLSMGGPITRYALAKRESQNGRHPVGLFMSYDSPQDGAHVNPDLQDWIKVQDPNIGAIGLLQNNLNSTAAKQMLRYNTYDPTHSFCNEFYDELNALNGDGYPHQSYNVAVSNGTMKATWGYASVGRHLMTLEINDFLIKDVPAVQLDCGPGSMMTDITMTRYGDIYSNPFLHVYYELALIFNPSYIPTWSALDLVNKQIDPITGDIISFDRSKFDDFVVQDTPLQHHELSVLTRNKIREWLNLDFNADITYEPFNGGSIEPDQYQIKILLGLPITVPPKTSTVNGRPVNYNFYEWWDGNTTNPRQLYASHDVSYIARMKGNRISNSELATASNAGRRLVRDENFIYHLVYEDGGQIWYTRSTDPTGESWTPEEKVSVGPVSADYFHRYPSIDYVNGKIGVVWTAIDQLEGQVLGFEIKSNIRDRQNGQWTGVTTLYWKTLPARVVMPVITSFKDYYQNSWYFLVCFDQGNSAPAILSYYTPAGLNGWQPVTGSLSGGSPSLGRDRDYLYLRIAYQKQGGISTRMWDRKNRRWGTAEVSLTSDLGYAIGNCNPSISLWNNYAHVTWESLDETMGTTVMHRTVDIKSQAGTPTTFPNGREYYGKPSMMLAAGEQSIYHTDPAGLVVKRAGNGKVWWQENLGAGRHPAAALHGTLGAVWTIHDAPPYNIASDLAAVPTKLPGEGGITGNSDTLAIFKRLEFPLKLDGTSSLLLELQMPRSAGQGVRFPAGVMHSRIFPVPSPSATLDFELRCRFKNVSQLPDSNLVLFHLEFCEGARTIRIATVKIKDVAGFNTGQTHLISRRIPLAVVANRCGYLSIVPGRIPPVLTDVVVQAGSTPGESLLSNSIGISDQMIEQQLPTEFRLHQNFPNPFNPATTIAFDLPEESAVELVIYDLTGRQIRTLLREARAAGSYRITWDGRDERGQPVASGIYLYRLTAGEYEQTRKMMYLR